MKINWKIRLKNPMFIAQLIMSMLLPILAYFGLTVQDLTTWNMLFGVLGDAIKNPYVLGTIVVSTYNAIKDPTTKGMSDSMEVMSLKELR